MKSEQHWAQKSESDDKIAGTWTFVPDDGWKENADGSGDSVNKIEKIDKDHIVYGRWTFVPAELRMKKVDAKTGEGLSDAKLVLYDETKNEVKKWTSTGEGDLLTNEDGLNIEQVYTIHESNAPVDYKLANDIAFMWKTDGSLKVFTPGVKVENGIIIMADEPVGKTDASITIVKSLVDHEGIPFRVVNESYFVALFSDESRAMDTIASEVVEIPFENASTASVTFENLELGKNYYVGELSMKEDGELITGEYSSLDDGRGIWTPVYGSYKVTPTEKDPAATYEFTNKFSKLPVKSNYFTTLKITKHTTKDGKDYATDKNFYFAVVDDNQERIDLTISMNGAATQDSGDIVFNLASRDEKLSFTVFETVKEGGEEVDNETNKDYQVSYNKKEVTLDIQNLAEEIVVTNEFTSNTNNNNKGSKGNGGGKGGSSPKTGDDTNALGYGLMLILASLIIFVEERRRRKRV